jgi:hypothetical protein
VENVEYSSARVSQLNKGCVCRGVRIVEIVESKARVIAEKPEVLSLPKRNPESINDLLNLSLLFIFPE